MRIAPYSKRLAIRAAITTDDNPGCWLSVLARVKDWLYRYRNRRWMPSVGASIDRWLSVLCSTAIIAWETSKNQCAWGLSVLAANQAKLEIKAIPKCRRPIVLKAHVRYHWSYVCRNRAKKGTTEDLAFRKMIAWFSIFPMYIRSFQIWFAGFAIFWQRLNSSPG